ncbi:MAG: NUDIX hydrolase [Clostridiales bacterium]|nr:NUDIX hydrolase [Clostridiales bacterium]
MEGYTRMSRTLKHKGAIVSCYTDEMKIPDGSIKKWDYIEHPGAAAMLAVRPDGKILMVRQCRPCIDQVTLEIPAGGLNPGEDRKICAMRELEEETGYHAKEAFHLFDLYTTVAFCDEKIGIYYATDLVKTSQHLDEGEYLNVEAYELSELLSMVLSGKIQDSKTMAALMAFEHLRQSGKIGNK